MENESAAGLDVFIKKAEINWKIDKERATFMLDNFQSEKKMHSYFNYVAITILLVAAVIALIKDNMTTLIGMFGSSGILVAALGRLLYVFDKVGKIVLRENTIKDAKS